MLLIFILYGLMLKIKLKIFSYTPTAYFYKVLTLEEPFAVLANLSFNLKGTPSIPVANKQTIKNSRVQKNKYDQINNKLPDRGFDEFLGKLP